MTYKPLFHKLTVKNSRIDGLGVFATEKIRSGTTLGVSHIQDERAQDGYWRTPLGGFINHSDNPNCEKETNRLTNNLYLKTNRMIKKGEELTVRYTLYGLANHLNMERGDPFKEGTD